MKTLLPRLLPGERARFVTLGLLLFINSLVQESNEVVATSGFVSNVGVEQVPWLWTAEYLLVILVAGAYSLVVDRTRRERLTVVLSLVFSLLYSLLYVLFVLQASEWFSYSALLIVNSQQWHLIPLLIGALANDMFTVAETKRLFPLLGVVGVIGSVAGNAVAAGGAHFFPEQNAALLLLNAGLMLSQGIALLIGLRWITISARQAPHGESTSAVLREGFAFVREVPVYRYMTVAMLMVGIGWTVIEYQLLVSASHLKPAALQAFYGWFKVAVPVMLLIVQSVVARWLLNQLGFRHIFIVLPAVLLFSLLLTMFVPGLVGVAAGVYLVRITMQGVDESSRQSFLGLVPDERRGRVGAFVEGYLYPLGYLIGCAMIGAVLWGAQCHFFAPSVARKVYLGLSCACAVVSLWAMMRFRATYDVSMLNWRLQRRRRASGLGDLEF
jgi:ATP/ADP translocase